MPHSLTPKKSRGFTLIEVIISLFIFAIISVIISYGLNNVFTAKERMSRLEQRLNQLQFTLTLFRHDTSQLIDYVSIAQEASTSGNNTQFRFTTTDNVNPMGIEPRSNLMQVSYVWHKGNLTRNIWFNTDNQTPPKVSSRVLLSNITNFKFRYLTPTGFIDSWPPPSMMLQSPPEAIQLSFTIPGWGDISQLYRIRGETIVSV